MALTLDDIVAGLHSRFALVPAFQRVNTAGDALALLTYEPSTIQESPTIYTLLESADYSTGSPVRSTTYLLLSRLCIKWQDQKAAEAELRALVPALVATVNGDSEGERLGDLPGFERGLAKIRQVRAGFIVISSAVYRIADITTEVLIK